MKQLKYKILYKYLISESYFSLSVREKKYFLNLSIVQTLLTPNKVKLHEPFHMYQVSYLQHLLIQQQFTLNSRVVLLSTSEGSVVVLHQSHDATFHSVLELVDLSPPLFTLRFDHRLHFLVIFHLDFYLKSSRGEMFRQIMTVAFEFNSEMEIFTSDSPVIVICQFH